MRMKQVGGIGSMWAERVYSLKPSIEIQFVFKTKTKGRITAYCVCVNSLFSCWLILRKTKRVSDTGYVCFVEGINIFAGLETSL